MLSSHFEGLFVLCVQESVVSVVSGWTRQIRSLASIICMHIHRVSSTDEVQSYLVKGLSFVESDLDPSFTSADALEVVLLNLSTYNMLDVGHSSKGLLVEVLGQASDINVDDLLLGEVRLLVVFLRVVAGERGGQERLLLLLGLANVLVVVWSGLPVVVGSLRGCLAVTMSVQRGDELTLPHVSLVVVIVVLADLTLGVGVEPVSGR